MPQFLATSVHRNVAVDFMHYAEQAGHPVVEWKVEFDPRGDRNAQDYDPSCRCKHVNLLRVTHVPGEEEYLFHAFSVFELVSVVWSTAPVATSANPHKITLRAVSDNKAEPENLPLAPWA